MEIKILGPGCPKCQQVEKIVRETVAESGVNARVEKIADLMKIADYGLWGTPAVVINDEIKCVGKIPKKEEIRSWLE